MRTPKRAAAILLGFLLALATSGCWVLDEIDAAQELNPSPKKKVEAKPEKGEERSFAQMLEGGTATLGEIKGKVHEAMKPPPDPDNTIIRCEVDGRSQFTRKHDCMALGGIVMR